MLREHLQSEVHTLEVASGNLQVAGCRRTGSDDHGVEVLAELVDGDGLVLAECRVVLNVGSDLALVVSTLLLGVDELHAKLKDNAFLAQQFEAAVDDRLVELEVRDAIAEQSACILASIVDSDGVALLVEASGGSQTGRTGTDDSDFLAIALRHVWLDIILTEGVLDDGGLVLAVGCWLVLHEVEHAGLLAERRADAAGELREVVGLGQQLIGQLPVAAVEGIVPLWRFVANGTSPVAERHTAVHAAACLQSAVITVECLLHFAEVVDAVMYRAVAGFLALHL